MLKTIISPTWRLADFLKAEKNGVARSRLIQLLNSIYLTIAIFTVVSILIYQAPWSTFDDQKVAGLSDVVSFPLQIFWFYFVLSRCNEIFMAFLKDASDKIKCDEKTSSLEFYERLTLSMRSYIELIINFAILYMLLPSEYWLNGNLALINDALFYSAATITTLADSSAQPHFWLVQLLSIYQIFCGFSLLIVCFTVYTSRAINDIGNSTSSEIFEVVVDGEKYNVTVKKVLV